jgi:hypothetical protein
MCLVEDLANVGCIKFALISISICTWVGCAWLVHGWSVEAASVASILWLDSGLTKIGQISWQRYGHLAQSHHSLTWCSLTDYVIHSTPAASLPRRQPTLCQCYRLCSRCPDARFSRASVTSNLLSFWFLIPIFATHHHVTAPPPAGLQQQPCCTSAPSLSSSLEISRSSPAPL